jgi:CubicO group peptidase (beta-lactamase class C family)
MSRRIFLLIGAGVLCAAGLLPAAPTAPRGEAEAVSKAIVEAVRPYVEKHELAGAVMLVADKQHVLSAEAVGWADVAAKKPMKTDALFWIASQSKPITAAAFMMLVDEGKVKLGDPVEKYLPEFSGVEVKGGTKPAHPLTVREILSHTSGLPFSSKQEQPTLDRLTLREGVLSYAKTPLLCEPGTRFNYSNAGINTAGRLIEVLSGMSYEAFLDKRLFGPLGMKDTTFWPSGAQLKRLAKGYRPNKTKDDLVEVKIGQLRYPLDDRKRQPMPAGGLFSTAADVGTFCQMMLDGGAYKGKQLISKKSVQEMTHKQTPAAVKNSYGLGWSTAPDGFGHGGAMATNMWVDTKRGLITVWMVQAAGFPGKGGQAQGAFKRAADHTFDALRK